MRAPALAPYLFGLGMLAVVVAIRPVVAAVVSVPGALALQRVGGEIVSISELMTAVAAVLAVPVLMRYGTSRALGLALGAAGAYLGLFAVVVAVHPDAVAVGEWVHRAVILLGGLVVGAWLAIERRFGIAVTLLAVAMAVVGVLAVIDSAQNGWAPAYPLIFHKNFVGSLTATTLLVLLIARDEVRLPRWAHLGCVLAIVAGLVASQSRGGMIAFGIGMIAWLVVTQLAGRGRRAKAAILVAGGVVMVAVQSLLDEVDPRNQGEFSSANVRRFVTDQTLDLWREQPWTGWGVDFWRDPDLRTYILDNGPTNVAVQALGEGGILGALGLIVLVVGVLAAFTRAGGPLVALGVSVLVARLAHGSVDQYWVAAPTAVTWVIAGAALMDSFVREREGPPPGADASAGPVALAR